MVCRLKIKKVTRVTMEELVNHLAQSMHAWPSQQLQALEIVINSAFINKPSLLYVTRTLFKLDQVCHYCRALVST